jgi:hypothetical protein
VVLDEGKVMINKIITSRKTLENSLKTYEDHACKSPKHKMEEALMKRCEEIKCWDYASSPKVL